MPKSDRERARQWRDVFENEDATLALSKAEWELVKEDNGRWVFLRRKNGGGRGP